MHCWDLSTASGLDAGTTAIMSSLHDKQQSMWFNQALQANIKSEPIDYHTSNLIQTTPPQTSSHQMSAMDLIDQIPSSFRHLGLFNPLTPPGYSGLMFPSIVNNHQQQQNHKLLTPSKAEDLSKPQNTEESVTPSLTPPLDVTPPKSPKDSTSDTQTPKKEDNNNLNALESRSDSVESYDEDSDEFNYDDIHEKVPGKSTKKRKPNGKPRDFKCKQCKHICLSKTEFWEHTRSHIKPEKMLQCPKCPFVTEYKHHLEYHLRNHSRSKPFQCPHCHYSCVNKSMLNSHLKSHSTVFQYRCVDCNYATKYCHSLKLHLRKYSHKPDIVLNLDGTPNPLPIIDVYGTRRGPKSKSTTSKLLEEISKNQKAQKSQKSQLSQLSPPLTPSIGALTTPSMGISIPTPQSNNQTVNSSLLPNALMANMLQNVGNNMSLFPYLNLNFQMFAAQQQQRQSSIEDNNDTDSLMNEDEEYYDDNESAFMSDDLQKSPTTTPTIVKSNNHRRKGRAFKLDDKNINQENIDEDEEDEQLMNQRTTPINKVTTTTTTTSAASVSSETSAISTTSSTIVSKISTEVSECKFCGIIFKDNILYTLHMGYHGYNDVFKCNMCGEKCDDHVQFFLHIAKFPHS
ncbi:unnamed protein product [Diamesa serratosioi]